MLLEGRLLGDAARSPAGVTLRLDVERAWAGSCPEAVSGGVQLTVAGVPADAHVGEWTAGRRLVVPAVLRRPGVFLDEGVPDAERQLARRGTTLVGTVKSAWLVTRTGAGTWPQEAAAALRARARRAVTRAAGDDSQAAAVGIAILIGDRAGLAPDLERRLQQAGTYHVLAISGGNLALFGGAVLGLCALFGLRGPIAVSLALVAVLLYAGITTGGASVWRAAAMAVVVLGTRLLDHRTAPLNALALAVAALVVYEPLLAVDTGLGLSVGATGGILLGAARLEVGGWRLVRWAAAVVVASLAAEAVLLPVQAWVFQRVTLAGLVLNLLAIPSMTVVQFSALAAVVVDAVWPSVLPLTGVALRLGVAGLLDGPSLLDVAPWLTWRVPPPHVAAVVAYYVVGTVWMVGPPRWVGGRDLQARRGARIATVALGAWIAVHPPSLLTAHGDGRLHLTMLDVGQGESLLVTFPMGSAWPSMPAAAAAAGSTSATAWSARPCGRAGCARSTTCWSPTAIPITSAAPPPCCATSRRARCGKACPCRATPGSRRSGAAAGRLRMPWRTLVVGDRISIGGVEVTTLHPPPPDWERRDVRNDDSVTLRLDFAATTLLLTGDIGHDVEATLAARPPPQGQHVPLKVAHHGSLTSTSEAWLAWAHPELALVSAGRGNRFGHPTRPGPGAAGRGRRRRVAHRPRRGSDGDERWPRVDG